MLFHNFKFYCKQCPIYPSDYIPAGIKRTFLISISAMLTVLILFIRRIQRLIDDKRKYKYTLGIIAIAKNESEYIQEWCSFHKAVGVDVIYLYDNDSFDDMKEKLQPFINSGFVKYHYVEGKGMQMSVYHSSLEKYKKECKYIAVIDCDEFLYTDDKKINLKKAVEQFFSRSAYIGGLAVNWIMFGDNGHEITPEGLCIESFTKCAQPGKLGTICIKTIVYGGRVKQFSTPHSCDYKWGGAAYDQDGHIVTGPFNTISRYPSPIRLNHYFCKSMEQWIKRRSIGDSYNKNYVRPIADFHNHNNNDIEDLSIQNWLQETKDILNLYPTSQN